MALENKKENLKPKLTPERTMEVADSLDYEAARKKSGAFSALKSGKNDLWRYGMDEAEINESNAKRYRGLALKAMKKKK
jgi:hypothetical protein